jgi:hypothetical protein
MVLKSYENLKGWDTKNYAHLSKRYPPKELDMALENSHHTM